MRKLIVRPSPKQSLNSCLLLSLNKHLWVIVCLNMNMLCQWQRTEHLQSLIVKMVFMLSLQLIQLHWCLYADSITLEFPFVICGTDSPFIIPMTERFPMRLFHRIIWFLHVAKKGEWAIHALRSRRRFQPSKPKFKQFTYTWHVRAWFQRNVRANFGSRHQKINEKRRKNLANRYNVNQRAKMRDGERKKRICHPLSCIAFHFNLHLIRTCTIMSLKLQSQFSTCSVDLCCRISFAMRFISVVLLSRFNSLIVFNNILVLFQIIVWWEVAKTDGSERDIRRWWF